MDQDLLNEDEELHEAIKELEELEPFMVEETEDAEVCLTCSKYRNGTKVCGIFKTYNEFVMSKGYPNIEDTFKCSEFREA